MGISDRVTVLDHGEKIAEGSPDGGPAEPAGHRGLPRPRRREPEPALLMATSSKSDAWRPTTATSRPSTGITLSVEPGEIVTLIGSNGAGKSTTLKTISGLLRPRPGRDLGSTGSGSTASAPTRSSRSASASRPKGAGSSRGCRHREPRDGRVPAPEERRGHGRLRTGLRRSSRGSRSGAPRRPARCPAASSRCSRSAGR